MRRSKLDSPKGRSGAVGTALALAAAALILAWGEDLPPWLRTGAVAGLLLASVVCLWRSPWSRRLARRATRRLLFCWLHSDQEKAASDYRHYSGILEEQCPLLGLSLRNVAQGSGISYLAICLFARFPDLIPRPDYLERLCRALLMPVEYLERRGSYGPECSYARLLRYDDLGYGKVFTWNRVRAVSQEELDEILATVEDLRREDLRKRGKES